MVSFECDYNNGCHPKVLERLMETNAEVTAGYGQDCFTAEAREKIRKTFCCERADVFFISGGTQTNQTVISSLLRSFEGVISCDTGHIAQHEAGAVEYSGHKVLTLPGHEGKMDATELRHYLEAFYQDSSYDHMVFPGLVYLSFPTEFGTIYSRNELRAIHEVCADYSIPLYIDGARVGYGLMSSECDILPEEFASLCDVFYIGGTKVGALCGEAVVFPEGNAPKGFFTQIKQHGALLAKGRLCAVQFDALFTDGLYFAISRHALVQAEKLKAILMEKGLEPVLFTPTNQQFVRVPDNVLDTWEGNIRVCRFGKLDNGNTMVRFCTSWSTSEEDLARLRELL